VRHCRPGLQCLREPEGMRQLCAAQLTHACPVQARLERARAVGGAYRGGGGARHRGGAAPGGRRPG
jgi:hypothetical protein